MVSCDRDAAPLHESPPAAPAQWGQSCSCDQSRARANEAPGRPAATRAPRAARSACARPTVSYRLSRVGVPAGGYRKGRCHATPWPPCARHPCSDRRPISSGASAARKCTPWRMVPGFGLAHHQAMPQQRTPRRFRGDHPVLTGAARYALPAAVVGAGILVIGPSPGVGWTLIVFGAWFAAHTSQRPPRRRSGTDPAHPASARRKSHRTRRAGAIDRRKRVRATTVAQPASRGPRVTAREPHA
jgi:hypothetical protein